MATKKQKREAGEARAKKALEESIRIGLAAQQKDRERRAELAKREEEDARKETQRKKNAAREQVKRNSKPRDPKKDQALETAGN